MSSDPRNFFNCIVFSKLREAVQLGQAAIRGTPVARFHQGGGFRPGAVILSWRRVGGNLLLHAGSICRGAGGPTPRTTLDLYFLTKEPILVLKTHFGIGVCHARIAPFARILALRS
jgi:hypothetical protein